MRRQGLGVMIDQVRGKLQEKIAGEDKILTRCEDEVTVDWPEVQAEVRRKAFVEVSEYIDRLQGVMDV